MYKRQDEALEWTRSEELHPFWFVKRAQSSETSNMELVYVKVDNIISSECKAIIKADCAKPIMEVAHVTYPCLKNTVDIEPDVELILKWSQEAVQAAS